MGNGVNKTANATANKRTGETHLASNDGEGNVLDLDDTDPDRNLETNDSNRNLFTPDRQPGNAQGADQDKNSETLTLDNDQNDERAGNLVEVGEYNNNVSNVDTFGENKNIVKNNPDVSKRYAKTPYKTTTNNNKILSDVSNNENLTLQHNDKQSQDSRRKTSLTDGSVKQITNRSDSSKGTTAKTTFAKTEVRAIFIPRQSSKQTISLSRNDNRVKSTQSSRGPHSSKSTKLTKQPRRKSVSNLPNRILQMNESNDDTDNKEGELNVDVAKTPTADNKMLKPVSTEACSRKSAVSAESELTGEKPDTEDITKQTTTFPEHRDSNQGSDTDVPRSDYDDVFEISSSLRSTPLDSRLFASESSDITYSDYGTLNSSDSLRDDKIRIKYGLMGLYKAHGFNVNTFPFLPPSDRTYIMPWMTRSKHVETEQELDDLASVGVEEKENYIIQKRVRSFKELFNEPNKRRIFLVGDHGTGKSLCLKYIIKCWLDVHMKKELEMLQSESTFTLKSELDENRTTPLSRNSSRFEGLYNLSKGNQNASQNNNSQESKDTDISSSIDKDTILEDSSELLKYEFLFFISLKHDKKQENIYELIQAQYRQLCKDIGFNNETINALLADILENEQETCLILIDDLDEWKPKRKQYKSHIKSTGLPNFDQHKMHTLVWTLTSLKLQQMSYKLMENDLKVCLHGIDDNASKELLEHIVETLNANHPKSRKPQDIRNLIKNTYLRKYERLPYILQSLVCILYQFQKNNLCGVFCQLLDIQFYMLQNFQESNNKKRKRNLSVDALKSSKGVALPRYFENMKSCQTGKRLLYTFSKSSYESWVQSQRSIDVNPFEGHDVSPRMVEICMQAGLLDRDDFVRLLGLDHQSKLMVTDKPIQALLAATYITMLCLDEAYSNMGNTRQHSAKINDIVDAHIDIERDIEMLLYDSDIIVFLSGLCPPQAIRMNKGINEYVNKLQKIQQYRRTLLQDGSVEFLRDIQKLTFICFHESLVTGEGIKEVFISDIFFDIDNMKYFKYLALENVFSMCISFDRVDNYDALSKFIFDGRKYSNLQKLVLEDKTSKMTRPDVELILRVFQTCSKSLYAFTCVLNANNPETYKRLFECLHEQLLNMSHLQALELAEITLSHDNFSALSAVISTKLRLRQLRLVGISCVVPKCEGGEHAIYLTEHSHLEYLEINGREVTIADLNATSLRSCVISNTSAGTELRIFDCLRDSMVIQSFTQNVPKRPPFVCKPLLDSMRAWDGLQRLDLSGTNFADNIVTVKTLHNLHRINLDKVQMTLDTWIGFVNSALLLSQSIQVYTVDVIITPNEAVLTRDGLNRPIQPEARAVILAERNDREGALDYVKKKTNFFRVLLELRTIFNFETVSRRN